MARKRDRTRDEAAKLLLDYESLNNDLPKQTRRQLGIFALAPTTGTEALEELVGRKLGETPFRHRSWFWWNCLATSDLGDQWERLVDKRNSGAWSWCRCLYSLRREATEDQWRTLGKRVGVPVLHDDRNCVTPSRYGREAGNVPRAIWTKGGSWVRKSPFTKLLILNQHLPPREDTKAYAERLGRTGVRKIERELHDLIDPDEILQPDAVSRAVDYVRRRIPDILGYERERTTLRTAAWFFTEPVEDEAGYFYPEDEGDVPTRTWEHRSSRAWFPRD